METLGGDSSSVGHTHSHLYHRNFHCNSHAKNMGHHHETSFGIVEGYCNV